MNVPELITAIAALSGALAWPTVVLVLLLAYRKSIGGTIARLPAMFDRVQSI